MFSLYAYPDPIAEIKTYTKDIDINFLQFDFQKILLDYYRFESLQKVKCSLSPIHKFFRLVNQ